MANTTQSITRCDNRQARCSARPVSNRACSITAGEITLLKPASRSTTATRIWCRVQAASLPRHCHSLLETWVLDTPKVTGGYDLREDERYWAYTEDSVWRNRGEFPIGREQIRQFLARKDWKRGRSCY